MPEWKADVHERRGEAGLACLPLAKSSNLKTQDFILELGRVFTFIDEEYKVQVGGEDYAIDFFVFSSKVTMFSETVDEKGRARL